MITIEITKSRCGTLTPHPKQFNSYHEAVLFGQKHAGYGCFLVDVGKRNPTRSEQLLIPDVEGDSQPLRKSKLSKFLQSLD